MLSLPGNVGLGLGLRHLSGTVCDTCHLQGVPDMGRERTVGREVMGHYNGQEGSFGDTRVKSLLPDSHQGQEQAQLPIRAR